MRVIDLKANERKQFNRVRRAERQYARRLRKVSRRIEEILKKFPSIDPLSLPQIEEALKAYSQLLDPWAKSVAASMIADVQYRDEKIWAELGRSMARNLREEIRKAPTGTILRDFMNEQVTLIKSLPLDAAKRVHKLVMEGQLEAKRASEIAKEIRKSGQVSKSRANLIARTEVARVASGLVMARATYVGSDGYIWRTVGDSDVRPRHRKLNGKFFSWDDPPVSGESGERAHAGMIYNCRCYPEPVLPDERTPRR